MVLSSGQAGLISTTIQGILYGIATIMYILTVWILVQNGKHQKVNWKMVIAACALLLFATAEMIVNIIRISEGYASIGPTLKGGPEQYFNDVTQTTFIMKSVLFNVQTLILDAVVIYRTYVVWQSMWPVLVPIFGWFGLLTAIVGTNVALVQARSGHKLDVFFVSTARWITANYASTLATNLSASCLLAYRIWYLNREAHSIRMGGQLKPVVRAVIESGLIYSIAITTALVSFVLKSSVTNIIWDLCSPIILIAFCMIIVRIGLSSQSTLNVGVAMAGSVSVSVGSNDTEHTCHCRRGTLNKRGNRDNVYDMKPISVEVTHFREVDGAMDVGTKSMSTRSTAQSSEIEERGNEKFITGSGC